MGKGRDLRVALQGRVKSSVETVGDQDVHSFTAEQMPPLTPEPGMPNQKDTLARVSVSTLKDWGPYVSWEKALLSDIAGDSDEIKDLARKLTKDATTPKEKLDRLWAYVAEEVRYQQEYETTIAGVKPHPPRVVLERGYGDCKDKALLMQYLAKSVGIDLRFALLKTTPFGRVEKNIPNQQFNHAINYVPAQSGFEQGFFLDSTTNGLDVGNLRGDDQGATSLVLGSGDKDFQFLQIPYQSAELEYEKHHLSIDLKDPATARANDKIDVRGNLAASFRQQVRNPEGAKKLYHSLSDRLFSGTTLLTGDADRAQDITTPLVVHLDTDVTNAVQRDGSEGRFTIPLQFPPGQGRHPPHPQTAGGDGARDCHLDGGDRSARTFTPQTAGLLHQADLLQHRSHGHREGLAPDRHHCLPEHLLAGGDVGLRGLPRRSAEGAHPPAGQRRVSFARHRQKIVKRSPPAPGSLSRARRTGLRRALPCSAR